RRIESHGRNLSARYEQLERSVRSKKTLEGYLAQTHTANVSISSESGRLSSEAKLAQTFHGLIIPDKPVEPAPDECCMSGCAVCIYDLYEESMESYRRALDRVRSSLVGMNIPSSTWPTEIRLPGFGTASEKGQPSSQKGIVLDAFEEMERRLQEK
ncbi:oxidoreductase-like protein, partial [Vararia minispora EC-137]